MIAAADSGPAKALLWLRHAQLAVNERIRAGVFRIPIHLALGHEAVAVAVAGVLRPTDRLLLGHRNVHYNLARLRRLRPVLDEFEGKSEGLAGGALGSMNLSQPDRGLIYSSSILGNNLPVAAGVALALKRRGQGGVAFVVTGDGAMEEGAFYETLLMAAAVSAPQVILIENNGWSMYTRIAERRREVDIGAMAHAVGLGYADVAGGDVYAVREALERIRTAALLEDRPQILEIGLSTLGDYEQDGRLINYHHGQAPKVVWSDWGLLSTDVGDPMVPLCERFGETMVREWAKAAHDAVQGEVS